MIAQREHVIAACRLAVKEVLDADDLNQEREILEEKLLLLNERIRRLVNDNARTEMDSDAYRREYDELSAQYRQTMDRSGEIDEELRSREARKMQIALFLRMFEKRKADAVFIWEKVQGGKTLESMFRLFTNAKKSVIIKHI